MTRALALVDAAVERRAQLIVLPEAYAVLGDDDVRRTWAADPDHPEACPALAPLLERTESGDRWIVAGGVAEHAPDGRCFNTAFVIGHGRIIARYRKMHCFDAAVAGVVRPESAYTAPGEHPTIVRTELGVLGLSVCYDLRFAELYRALTDAGAELLLVPSAFTLRTGQAHWQPLLRARAIENQAFVLAAAQHGKHDDAGARESYGHSMIIDPWGTVVAAAGPGEAVVTATLDGDAGARAEAAIPCKKHRRLTPNTRAQIVETQEASPR